MKVVAALFIICAVALILIILVQKGRGGGLSGVFGGGIASGILGSKTGDFLTWVTIILAGVFLALVVVMAKYYKPSVSDFGESAAVTQSALPPAQQTGETSNEVSLEQPLVPVAPSGESSDVNSPGD